MSLCLLSELKVPRVGLSLSFRKSRTNQFPVGSKRSERHWYLPSVIPSPPGLARWDYLLSAHLSHFSESWGGRLGPRSLQAAKPSGQEMVDRLSVTGEA